MCPLLRGPRTKCRIPVMNPYLDLENPTEILQEIALLDHRIEELSEHRKGLKERLNALGGFARLVHKMNFLMCRKQIARHIRVYRIQRERLELHYERLRGKQVPDKILAGE